METIAKTHTSSTGQPLTNSAWLDVHFSACQPEYEEMLRSVNIQPSWQVLDAGCGCGSYLPLLTTLVGPAGKVTALDLSPENIAVIQEQQAEELFSCPISALVGTLTSLPFPDNSFDAVWTANVTQYLTDAQLRATLGEFQRVVKPGGLVAVKDVDMQLMRLYPLDQFLVTHLCEASVQGDEVKVESRGSLRGRELRRWLEKSGLQNVWQRTFLIERWSPLSLVEHKFFSSWLAYLAEAALQRNVNAKDLEIWRTLCNPDSPNNPVNQPDFYACEGQVVAVGIVPETKPKF